MRRRTASDFIVMNPIAIESSSVSGCLPGGKRYCIMPLFAPNSYATDSMEGIIIIFLTLDVNLNFIFFSPHITIVACRPGICCHVTFTGICIPLLNTNSTISACILAAFRWPFATIYHQRTWHHSVFDKARRNISKIDGCQASLKSVARHNGRW